MDYRTLAMELIEKMYILNKARPQRKVNEYMQGEPFVLQYLAFHEGSVMPSEISQYMHISTARIAVALNNMEKKGLITRRIDTSDRRRILVDLTAEGKILAEEQKQSVIETFTAMISLLGEKDALEYVRITGRLAELVLQNKNND